MYLRETRDSSLILHLVVPVLLDSMPFICVFPLSLQLLAKSHSILIQVPRQNSGRHLLQLSRYQLFHIIFFRFLQQVESLFLGFLRALRRPEKAWVDLLLVDYGHEILRPIGNFVLDHNGGIGTEFAILRKGSYNISLRLKDENEATVIRLSQPGAVFFPKEKGVNEVAIMRFLMDKTSIPIPFIHHSGTKKESPLELSPFIIMDYIEHETKMYDALNTPRCPTDERGILDPAIDKDRLEMLYGQLAGILL